MLSNCEYGEFYGMKPVISGISEAGNRDFAQRVINGMAVDMCVF